MASASNDKSSKFYKFVDTEKLIKRKFAIPTKKEISQLKPKQTVRVSNGFESFTIRVAEVGHDMINGTITEHLLGDYDYAYGDKISIRPHNILYISDD